MAMVPYNDSIDAVSSNRMTVTGQRAGWSKGKALIVEVAIIAVALIPAFHVYHLVSYLAGGDDVGVFMGLVCGGLFGLVFAMVEENFAVTAYDKTSLSKSRPLSVAFFIGAMVFVCIAGSIAGFSYSITTSKIDTKLDAHNATGQAFGYKANALLSVRNIEREQARKDGQSNSAANLKYNNALLQLSQQQGAFISGRPDKVSLSYEATLLIYIVLSMAGTAGVFILVIARCKYHQPPITMPRETYKDKLDQDFKAGQAYGLDTQLQTGQTAEVIVPITPVSQGESIPLYNPKSGYGGNPTPNSQDVDNTYVGAAGGDSETVDESTVRTVEMPYDESHYQVIKNLVILDELKPTARPLKTQLIKMNVKFIGDAARSEKVAEIMSRLIAEGVALAPVKKGAATTRNPAYNSEQNQEPALDEDSEEAEQEGSDILNLICPACGDTPSIQISDLSPKHDNVRCGECSTVFGAYDSKPDTDDAYIQELLTKGQYIIYDGVFVSITPRNATHSTTNIRILDKNRDEAIWSMWVSSPWDYVKARFDEYANDDEFRFHIEKVKQS